MNKPTENKLFFYALAVIVVASAFITEASVYVAGVTA